MQALLPVEGEPMGRVPTWKAHWSRVATVVTPTDLLAIIISAGWWTGLARAAMGGTPYFAAALDLAAGFLVLWVVVMATRRGRLRQCDMLLCALVLAYMVWAAVEILNPNVPGFLVGLEGYRKTAFTMIAVFVVALSMGRPASRFYALVALGAVPPILWGIRQFYFPLPIDAEIVGTAGASFISFHSGPTLRAFSPTAGPFHFGILAGATTIIALVLANRDLKWMVIAGLAAFGLGLSLTRANILATFIAVAVVAVVLAQRGGIRAALSSAGIGGVLLVSIACGAGLIGSPPPSLVRQMLLSPSPSEGTPTGDGPSPTPTASRPDLGELVEGVADPLSDKSLQFRLEYWAEYLDAIRERPLTGYGTSSAGDGFGHLYAGTSKVHFDPHSLYLKPALELGVGGLVVLLAILARSLARARKSDALGLVGPVGIGVLILVGISGLTGPMLDAYPLNLLFWATVGWIAGPVRRGAGLAA